MLIICFVFYLFLLVFSESYDSNININIPNDYNLNYTQNDNELNKLKNQFDELSKSSNNINKNVPTNAISKDKNKYILKKHQIYLKIKQILFPKIRQIRQIKTQ